LSRDRDRPRRRPIVLASASPRRRELLASIGLPFTVRPAAIDESPLEAEPADAHVARLALEKAAATGQPGELVIAADTVVVVDGEILGKPRDSEDAHRMLGRIQGREHRVLTCVALREVAVEPGSADRVASAVDESVVRIRRLGVEEIAWYVATGEPADKAGAYALQGIGGLFVEAIRGSSSNVIGLPLAALYDLFQRLGYDLREYRRETGGAEPLDTLPPP
jgi:septum formation protein